MAKKPTKKPVRGVVPGAAQYYALRQAIAGLAETTIANSSEVKGGYRPALLDVPGAVAAVVGTLVNRRKDGKAFSGNTAAEQYANNALRRSQLATQRTNRTLGINDPQNTAELAARIIPSVLAPAPKGSQIAKLISKAPGGAKVVAAAKATPKYISTPAKVAVEAVVPLRQTSLKTAVPVATAITGGLDVLMDDVEIDPSTGQRYESSIADALGVGTDTPNEEEVDPEEAAIEQMMLEAGIELGDIDEEGDIEGILAPEISDDEVVLGEEQDKLSKYEAAAIALGTTLAGAVAVNKLGSSFMRTRAGAAVAPENIGRFTGKRQKTSILGKKDRVVTELFEQDRPLRSAINDFLGRDQAQAFGYKLDRMSNAAIQSKSYNFFRTGKTPGYNMSSVKLGPTAEAYAKELTPEEQILVSDALNAASSLDDYRRLGVQTSMLKDRGGNATGPRQLEMLVQSVTTNPKLAKYFNAIQKSYDDLAKYEVGRGLSSYQEYQSLRQNRPNYVPHRKNLETDVSYSPVSQEYSANTDIMSGLKRSTEEGGGISASSGIGNPFTSVFDDWSETIRRAEHNDARADFLSKVEATNATDSAGHKLVQAVDPTHASKDKNVHTVLVNGRQQAYLVRDPQIARSLHFTPRVAVPVLEQMRQFTQNFTTGPIASLFNFFGTTVSPVFESMAASLLKNPGTKIGALNHLFVGGYTGGLRYIGDAVMENTASLLRDNLIREASPLKTLLGEQNLENFTLVLENAVRNSTKSLMDEAGITSRTMYGSPDPSKLLSGVEKIAPKFTEATGEALQSDIKASYKAGEITAFRAAAQLAASKIGTLNADSLLRAYALVSEAMHNGARYTAVAANKKALKAGRIDYDKFVSDMRRLTADTSKHGANKTAGVLINSSMYGPINVQTLFELGRRARANPGNIMFNTATTSMTLAALGYLAQAYDESAREKHLSKTPSQKATSVTTFGGVEIPIEPIMRPIMAPILATIDHISGANKGEFDPNFIQTLEKWLEGDGPPITEEFLKDFNIRMAKGVEDNMPVIGINYESGSANLSSIPAVGIGIAIGGGDPGMARITGEIAPPQEQDITGLDTSGGRRPDSMLPAYWENLLSTIFSTTGRTMIGIADDAYRANVGGAETKEVLQMAADSWKDKAVSMAKPIKPIFGEYESVKSASDLNYELMKEREPGIETAVRILNKDYRSANLTGVGSNALELPETSEVDPELEGTEALFIASLAQELSRDLARNKQVLNAIGDQIAHEKAEHRKPLEQRNLTINEKNEERKYQRMMMLIQTRSIEGVISERIGRPFTFDGFNPKDYLKPLAPEN